MSKEAFLIKRRKFLGTVLGTIAASSVGSSLPVPSMPQQNSSKAAAPSIIVFDVNETLIDIESIGPFFERIFGDPKVVREWFNQLILYSNAITLSGYYQTFFTLGQGVLEMLAKIHGVAVTSKDIEELRDSMRNMPAHKDSAEGLRLLKEAGFRLVTLTNSPLEKNGGPLERAGLGQFIEREFSVDTVRRFKPAPQVYHLVAEMLDVAPSSICLVAAHTWDTVGAQSVGFFAGLVARSGNAPLPVKGLPQPQAVAPDLPGVAKQLITLWR